MIARVKLRTIAIALSLGYTVVRVTVVHATLAGYGINPWVFFLIDAITGILYVLGIEQLILAMDRRRKASGSKILVWSIIAIASFALPYLYLFTASRELPLGFTIGLGIIVLLFLVNALLSFGRRVYRRPR